MVLLELIAAAVAALPSQTASSAQTAPPAQEPEVDPFASDQGWSEFLVVAEINHGPFGGKAARFLLQHRPERDSAMPTGWLLENLRLALEARERFPWAKDVPDELFLNDVLPYAVLDEKRENWRPMIYELVAPLVADCETAEEAAQKINRSFFHKIKVHYNTGRKRPNACATESIAQGRATCTGLTILYVEACRSIGIPARAAGVQLWHDDRGNHTWPEVWDGERWRFTGADEFDVKGLDRAWFVADAARATPGETRHAVWASTWKRGESHFPLVWNRGNESVAAVDVTERYRGDEARIEEALEILASDDKVLGEEASQRLVMELWKERKAALAEELAAEAEAKAYRLGDKVLRVKENVFGEAPRGGHSLWISMHGGGGAPTRVNDRQWENQIKLYEPDEGIYVAPRAPTDTWDLWHQGHIDGLFDRMIASYVTRRGVHPDRVYLMGYSAGGDGVYQLAPRIADRFAAASMMAGHPNETQPDGLRNIPFALFMGGDDAAYDRNKIAGQWKEKLAALQAADPKGYDHSVTIYQGKGHWMDGEDKAALPWMAERTRRAWPNRVVWLQDDVTHARFYWLGVAPEDAKPRTRMVADVQDQTIRIRSTDVPRATLYLHDRLIDLDRPVTVEWNGVEVFSGDVARTRGAIEASLDLRADPTLAATAMLAVERPN